MPSMKNIALSFHAENDIEVLAHYVRYLSIRGEVERTLMMKTVPDLDLDSNDSLFDPSLQSTAPDKFKGQVDRINAVIESIAEQWLAAENIPVASSAETNVAGATSPSVASTESGQTASPVKTRVDRMSFASLSSEERDAFLASANRGKELFSGEIGACFQCHGKEGKGDGKLKDFDEWTKDWTVRNGIDPNDKSQWKPLKKLGFLKPVPLSPRNLQLGVIRFGRDHHDLYRIITSGIEGTPMPAAAKAPKSRMALPNHSFGISSITANG